MTRHAIAHHRNRRRKTQAQRRDKRVHIYERCLDEWISALDFALSDPDHDPDPSSDRWHGVMEAFLPGACPCCGGDVTVRYLPPGSPFPFEG